MTQPVAPDLILTLAAAISSAKPGNLSPVQEFRRIKTNTPDGVEESVPSITEPTRNRLFNIIIESAVMSTKQTMNDTIFSIDAVFLIRIFYAQVSAIPGQGDKSFFEQRVKFSDYVILMRALILANIFSGSIAGASSIVDGGAVFPPGLIEWRLNVTLEEFNS